MNGQNLSVHSLFIPDNPISQSPCQLYRSPHLNVLSSEGRGRLRSMPSRDKRLMKSNIYARNRSAVNPLKTPSMSDDVRRTPTGRRLKGGVLGFRIYKRIFRKSSSAGRILVSTFCAFKRCERHLPAQYSIYLEQLFIAERSVVERGYIIAELYFGTHAHKHRRHPVVV